MEAGERWNEAKYHEMNVRYQEQTMEHLRESRREGRALLSSVLAALSR